MSQLDDVSNTIKNTPGLGKSMAKWGALGALVAIPVPFVGPIIGAVAGAGYAYMKRNKRV
ncbi:hypothetical protein SAMN06297144_1753 [Sphingomonas guangdongensis]|uniref:Uncharacterized protein n=1 Tax=Sphingomonas guangdongensis TaxID=1141890 RepID=A0A285QXU3_9SPHN|nr:hypothetical protein [Sphingomonas guangdongensis]SOB86646.1 hypothetical protein SAMN06297144_1753 [Sphingomonas guangdongensis]